MVDVYKAHPIVASEACGRVLKSERALSLWGGIDPTNGMIIDQRHDLKGSCTTGRILLLPAEKGSSTGSAVLLELIRTGRAPAAILTKHVAPILALGAIVAEELYGRTIPVLTVDSQTYDRLKTNTGVCIDPTGNIRQQVLE